MFRAITIDVEFEADPPGNVRPPAFGCLKPIKLASRRVVSFSIIVNAGETEKKGIASILPFHFGLGTWS